jgi:hypothetical protein
VQFAVAWLPDEYAFFNSRLLSTLTCFRNGIRGDSVGDSSVSAPSCFGIHSAMFDPMGI